MRVITAAAAFVAAWVAAGVIAGAAIPEFVLLGVATYAVFHVSVRRLSLWRYIAP